MAKQLYRKFPTEQVKSLEDKHEALIQSENRCIF